MDASHLQVTCRLVSAREHHYSTLEARVLEAAVFVRGLPASSRA